MKNIFFLTLFLGVGSAAQAQGPATGGPTPTADPTAVPLDGGASLLLAGGMVYGLRKLRQSRKTQA